MTKSVAPAKPPSQLDKFKAAARELECDESEDRFNAALMKIGKAKPSAKPDGSPELPQPDKGVPQKLA